MEEVKEIVKQVRNTISSTKNSQEIVSALLKLHGYLPFVESTISAEEKSYFIQHHYARFLYYLLEFVEFSWESTWNSDQLAVFDDFFLKGTLNDSLLVLIKTISETKPSYKLEKCVTLVEAIIKPKHLSEMFINMCKMELNPHTMPETSWDELINIIISLPERMANKLQTNNRLVFHPEKYFTNLSAVIVITLKAIADEIRKERDCSLQFLSRIFGRCCAIGQADAILMCVLTHLIRSDDYLWRRMCQKFLLGIPDRDKEKMLASLLKLVPQSKWMKIILGDAVTTNSKLRMLLTQKFLLLRTFSDDKVLRNILGYLNETNLELLISVFKSLLSIWGDKIAVTQTSLEQHTYITRALLISAGLVDAEKLSLMRVELVSKLMDGVSCHLQSPNESVRLLGMITAECLTQLMDPESPAIKFEYTNTQEIVNLKALIKPEEVKDEFDISYMDKITEQLEKVDIQNVELPVANSCKNKVEDLDSDDDLEPYDMSNDTTVIKFKKPSYLRDCLAGISDQSNPDRTEVCLQTVEYLIRNERDLPDELALEVAQCLLHLENNSSISNFTILRHKSIVAALVCSPIKVATYLTQQFYERNYSIRQRLDILQVLAIAAQELSRPTSENKSEKNTEKMEDLMLGDENTPQWQMVINKRLESKTRYFHKTKPQKTPIPVPNRFASVAGYFFFDLMKNYDSKLNNFDLLGDDCLLLCRLLNTLGSVMNSAINSPIVPQMARCLLDFILPLRYHTEPQIRKGVLFCFCIIILSLPSHTLTEDFKFDFLECRMWLLDVVENDSNKECCVLASQAIRLITES